MRITEAAFQFAVINEMYAISLIPNIFAPRFPSQWMEGNGEPYDAMLQSYHGDCFFQFKRSSPRVRRQPNETHNFNRDYFQFELFRKNDYAQHRALKQFAAHAPETYYVAPKFYLESELHQCFGQRTVLDNSVQLLISDMPDIRVGDPQSHRIYFDRSARAPTFCSEPTEIKGTTLSKYITLRSSGAESTPDDFKRRSDKLNVIGGDADEASKGRNKRFSKTSSDYIASVRDNLVTTLDKTSRRSVKVTETRSISVARFSETTDPYTVARALRYTLDLEWIIFS